MSEHCIVQTDKLGKIPLDGAVIFHSLLYFDWPIKKLGNDVLFIKSSAKIDKFKGTLPILSFYNL